MKRFFIIILILTNCFLIISQEVDLKKGLVAYYPFNGNARDESGNGNNGNVSGAVLTEDKLGKPNSAYYFNGNSYITVPDNNSIDFNTSFSAFAWVNLDEANNNQKILCKAFPNRYEGGYILGIDKNQVYPEVFDDWNKSFGGKKGGEVVKSKTWTFIGVTLSNNKLKYYCNDQCILELDVNPSSLQRNNNDLIIGGNSWEKPPKNLMTKGKVDEIRLYNRAVNMNEIQALYSLMKEEALAVPVISWDMPQNYYSASACETYDIRLCIKTTKPLNALQIYLNDRLYTNNSGRGYNIVPSGTCTGAFEQRLILYQGENRIKVVAINDAGSAICEERIVNFQAVKQDIVGPVITLFQPQGQRGFKMNVESDRLTVSGRATDESGIFNITINDMLTTFDSNGNFSSNINLRYGENTITIRATDNNQNRSEFTFFVSGKAIEVVVNNNNVVSNGKKYALVIGNGDYKSAPLRNPVNDANLISSELKNLGFEVNTITNGSQTQMKLAISQFGDLLGKDKDAIGLFYYAGHGIQAKGKNYVIPTDANIEKEADLVVYCVDLDELLANMEYAGNNLNMIILDACRNNPFGQGFRSQAGTGLATINAPSGTIIAFATSPGSVAADGEGSNGLYTQEFVKALQIPNLKIEDVFKKVRTQVKTQSGGKQVPWENSALEGDFYFKKQ